MTATRAQHLADANISWRQALDLQDKQPDVAMFYAASAQFHAIMALNAEEVIDKAVEDDVEYDEPAELAYKTYHRDGGVPWKASNNQDLWRRVVAKVLDAEIQRMGSAFRAGAKSVEVKPEARFDLIHCNGEDFTVGLAKSAPIGVQLLVMVEDRQYFIRKNIDHITVTETGKFE